MNHYLLWHYTRAFKEIFHVWFNLIWFVIHFFSISQLMRSWFSPWKRMVEDRGRTWNMEDLAGYVIIGFISRIVGFLVRSVVIVMGLFFLLLTIIGGLITYVFWIMAPLVIIGLLGFGITLLVA
jgi:hypothetical protein